jgi:hypothetical protein
MPALNIPFGLSVLGAFLASTVVAYTYVWPALRSMPRYDALRLLAAFNAFRFFGMNFMVPGFVSPDFSASFASQIAWGDFIAAILALLSMAVTSASDPKATEVGATLPRLRLPGSGSRT